MDNLEAKDSPDLQEKQAKEDQLESLEDLDQWDLQDKMETEDRQDLEVQYKTQVAALLWKRHTKVVIYKKTLLMNISQ